MKGRKDNTDDRKRQGQHERPNTNMDRHGQDQPYSINFFRQSGTFLKEVRPDEQRWNQPPMYLLQ